MKFLIIARRFHTNLYYRAVSLIEAGHEVRVRTLYKGKSEYYKHIDIETLKLSMLSIFLQKAIGFFKRNYLKSTLQLRLQWPGKDLKKTIKEYQPNVIILKAYQDVLALKTLCVANRNKSKVLMLTQTTFTQIKGSRFLFRLNIKLFKKLGVYAYVTPIKSNYDSFLKFGIKNVFYLPFVFPATTFLKKESTDINKPIQLISVGKIVRRKEHLLLIKAIHTLIDENYLVELCIYGEIADKQYFEEICNYIRNNKLNKIIKINANIAYDDLLKEYPKYDLFILPAYAEPAAYSPVEAMANGLPVVLSNQCGTNCYIKEGTNGYIFEAKNMDSLMEKLKMMILNREELNEMRENAFLSAKRNHNLEQFEKDLMSILK